VRLEQTPGAVTLRIVDDGHGFDPRDAAPGRHGVPIMRERTVHVGAQLTIDSTPGQGTRVRFSWTAVEPIEPIDER
jgi:two-component system nitrate/nitrite sensor histidine kinase NarX